MKRIQVLPHVMADMAARIAKGADEYGEPLTTNNGRDALQDAYEEALDLALYLKQAIMERKEVMRTEPVSARSESASVTAPAVSESAAGDAEIVTHQVPVYAECGHPLAACEFGYTAELRCPTCAWPGPDWSQAPEWAMWWAKDSDVPNAIWWRDQPDMNEKGYWTVRDLHHHGFAYVNAPHFNYPGHWRDSLRKRP